MQQQLTLRLLPSQAASQQAITEQIALSLSVSPNKVNGYYILKQSIDARSRQPWINLTVNAFINEPFQQRDTVVFEHKDVHASKKQVIVVGSGPAGLFAALKLIELGVKPVIIERGKDVRSRRRDLAALNKEGEVNPESNYCFGEGGAGTYSDGKLYTRSNKRGDIDRILQLFVQFGAEEKILYQSHPHIGTNKLPHIITAMREFIRSCGGEIHFETKLTNFIIEREELKAVEVNHSSILKADAAILATGHSARDIFELLHQNNILIEAKPFALGVRIEHPQELIDSIQYKCFTTIDGRGPFLPPASYSLVEQVRGKGVFSFCMCPGGIIAPAATSPGELVVNGWSPSKRNNAFANSGMVVSIDKEDAIKYFANTKTINENDPLLLMKFQQAVEQKAFAAGGGKFVAPAQRMMDVYEKKTSSSLPDCSYLPGITSADLSTVLPDFVFEDLRLAFKQFGQKMKGYFTNEAIAVATESRTSSPVRIPRDAETLQHTQIKKLFPCGEGAGYAGGIVSAAMDGERVAIAAVAAINHSSTY